MFDVGVEARAHTAAILLATLALAGCGDGGGQEGTPPENAAADVSPAAGSGEFEIASPDPAGVLDVIRLSYGSILGQVRISGTVQNTSEEVVYIDGYRAHFLSASGTPVAEAPLCRASRRIGARDPRQRCYFDTPRLEPGFVSDFRIDLRGRPSVARGDTARLVISYSNP